MNVVKNNLEKMNMVKNNLEKMNKIVYIYIIIDDIHANKTVIINALVFYHF